MIPSKSVIAVFGITKIGLQLFDIEVIALFKSNEDAITFIQTEAKTNYKFDGYGIEAREVEDSKLKVEGDGKYFSLR